VPEPHSWNEEDAARVAFFGEEAWRNVQSRLSKLIGANLHFIPPIEAFRCFSANNYPSCSDLVTSASPSEISRCINEAFKFGMVQRKSTITCVHRMHYTVTQIQMSSQFVGTILIGPVILGKRESPEMYGKMCEEFGFEKEQFLDRVREIRLFSFNGIQSIVECLEEVVKYVIRLNTHSEISK